MKKIYAREVDPEFFDYRAYLDEDMLETGSGNLIAAYGNREFCGMNADLIKDIEAELQDCKYDIDVAREDDNLTLDEQLEEVKKTVRYYFGSKRALTDDETIRLIRLCDLFATSTARSEEFDIICEALSIKFGIKYDYTDIRGYCQGDYQYVFYPEDTSKDFIKFLEAVYFATGTEFAITEKMFEATPDFDEEVIYHDYTYLYRDEDIKNWIAKNAGVTPEEVCLVKIKSSYNVKHYEYEEV